MKTQTFIETVESMGFKVVQGWFKNHDSHPYSEYEEVIFIMKDDEKVIHVWLTEKWLVKNDYYGFAKLSEVEKAELMATVNKYVSTEKKDR